jgi:hypothetical protein
MSTLWTPGGERPVSREPAGGRPESGETAAQQAQPSEEEMQRQIVELRDRLARTPAEVVIANHAYGLFELAALHLSLDEPQLDQARLAIDALGYLVEGLGKRLGDASEELMTGLGQMRLAFVQVQAAEQAGPGGQAREEG